MEWADQEQWFRDLAADGEIPKALLSKPELAPSLGFYYTAFWALSGDRALGMGSIGSIPFTSIDRYASRVGITGRDEFDRFHVMIRRMDEAFLKNTAEKTKSEGGGS